MILKLRSMISVKNSMSREEVLKVSAALIPSMMITLNCHLMSIVGSRLSLVEQIFAKHVSIWGASSSRSQIRRSWIDAGTYLHR